MSHWKPILAGTVLIGIGLAIWWTAFILVPGGLILIGIGVVKYVRSA